MTRNWRRYPVWFTAISSFRPNFKDLWACRQLYEAAMAALPARVACKLTVDILALAHDRGCEAELAMLVAGLLAVGALPDMVAMRARFAPDPTSLPNIPVLISPLEPTTTPCWLACRPEKPHDRRRSRRRGASQPLAQ